MNRYHHALGCRSLVVVTSLFLPWMSVTYAQDSELGSNTASPWSLGIAAVSNQKVYRDIDRDNIVFPLVGYENDWISVSVPKVDFKLYSTETMSFRLRGRYTDDGYSSDDSTFLAGMNERKSSAWVGGAFIWKNDIANVSAELLADAMGNSKGTRAGIQLDHRFGLSSFGLTPRLGAEWYDRKFVDYYYGVKPSEVIVGRNAYQGDSTTAVLAGLRLDYSPSRHHTTFLDLGATHFGSAIKDSPLVEKTTQTSVSLGYLYRF